jgi:ribose transport system permease protein
MSPYYRWLRASLGKRETGIIISIIILVSIFSIVNPAFLKIDNLTAILRACAFIGITSVGMAFLLISGMIDLSVGSTAGLAAIVTSYLIVKSGFPILPSYVVGLMVGGIIGWINYTIIFKMKIPAFLATIGTMYAVRGIAQFISNGYTIYPLPKVVESLGSAQPFALSYHLLIFVLLVIGAEIILNQTIWGLCVRATGSDREIARMTEVNVTAINLSTFIIAGIMAALAGLLLMSRVITGHPNMGAGYELQSITACAIGGVSLSGYEGGFIGVFLGVLAIQIINNGMVTSGVSVYLQNVVVGMLLIIIAAIDFQRRQQLNIGDNR